MRFIIRNYIISLLIVSTMGCLLSLVYNEPYRAIWQNRIDRYSHYFSADLVLHVLRANK